jgi:hypothetical protein
VIQTGLDSAGMRVNYKDFSLNVLFDTSQGNDIAERTRYVLYGFGTHADVGSNTYPRFKNYRGAVIPAAVLQRNIADYGAGPI